MNQAYVVFGKESVGKSQLIRSVTGQGAISEKLKGSTLSLHHYKSDSFHFIDTPGIVLENDSVTTQMTLEQLGSQNFFILMVSAYAIDDDLKDLLPLVQNKRGIIVITHWDKVKNLISLNSLVKLEQELGVSIFKVDARNISTTEKTQLLTSLKNPKEFLKSSYKAKVGFKPKSKKSIFDTPYLGPLISLVLLILPAWIAVQFANQLADSFYDPLLAKMEPLQNIVTNLPEPLNYLLAENYGIVSMLPFLFLYALSTVFVFTAILSLYKSSGLIDRLSHSLHNYVIALGLTGRDLVRIIMGFGCNVPSIISTRSCSNCTRGNCISAISFGAACSYQLPATIAVFSAAQMDFLVIPYLLILTLTTILYIKFFSSLKKNKTLSKSLLSNHDYMQWPSLPSIWFDMKQSFKDFFATAFPIFMLICLAAGLLDWLGIVELLSIMLSPLMAIFNLPDEAATSIVLGSIRKDGIAIGLLDPSMNGLKGVAYTPVQVLTVVYLAGVLLPCIVTLWTIVKEMNFKFAFKLVQRQMLAASLFSMVIAWTGWFLF